MPSIIDFKVFSVQSDFASPISRCRMPSWYSSIPINRSATEVGCIKCAAIETDQAQLDSFMISEVINPTQTLVNQSLYSKAPKINSTVPVIPPLVINPVPPEEQVFDYAVIRYLWASTDGTDLDTRTAILDVNSVVNGRDLGWSRYGDGGGSDGAYIGTSSSNYYMFWGGDNLGSGVEAVLVDFKKISSAFSLTSSFKIRLRANWYGSRLQGNVRISITTYLGGTMARQVRDFVNVGGAQKFVANKVANVASHSASNVDGDSCGFITYDPVTRSMTLS